MPRLPYSSSTETSPRLAVERERGARGFADWIASDTPKLQRHSINGAVLLLISCLSIGCG
jgi:hypothetical protein